MYVSKLPYVVQHEEEERLSPGAGLTIYGSTVTTLSARIPTDVVKPYTRLPSIYVDFVEHLTSKDVIQTKDLFFLQADCASLYAFVGDIDQGNPQAEWGNLPALVSGFRLLFDCMPVPFLGDGAYSAFDVLTSTRLFFSSSAALPPFLPQSLSNAKETDPLLSTSPSFSSRLFCPLFFHRRLFLFLPSLTISIYARTCINLCT